MNSKDKVNIAYRNSEEGQTLRLEGSVASLHAGLLVLIRKIADNLDVTVPDVLEALERLHELGAELFVTPPINKLTPMERFLQEMNKPIDED